MKYLKFSLPESSSKPNLIQRIIMQTLYFFKMTANSDYDIKINDVKIWLIEFDENDVPIREIGLDENNEAILKMPYEKNYGFWTDNELLYDDFINRFSAVSIDSITFESKWDDLI